MSYTKNQEKVTIDSFGQVLIAINATTSPYSNFDVTDVQDIDTPNFIDRRTCRVERVTNVI